MILFFYWPNDFLLKRKLNDAKEKYREKSGNDFSLQELDLKNSYKFSDIELEVQTVPFLAIMRFVIFHNIFSLAKDDQAKFVSLMAHVSQTTVLCLVQVGEPDKRTKLYRELTGNKKSIQAQYFGKLDKSKRELFIFDEVESSGGKIDHDALVFLGEIFEDDFWSLSNTLKKLIFTGDHITKELILQDVKYLPRSDIFALTDFVARSQTLLAVREARNLISAGNHPLMILSILNYQFRTLSLIKENLSGHINSYAIARQTKLSPFQVNKNINYARNFSWQRIKDSYNKICILDDEAKTGKIEPEIGLLQLVAEISGFK